MYKNNCCPALARVGMSGSGAFNGAVKRVGWGGQGRSMELHPDGNSLDMMTGLLYAKR